ncbi:MAG: UDP-glucose 4-epimerase GalE [Flavobacteriaceae bacterium]|nr:UDP-glucose 4-epimerase GalE [Flavobacteriaceae bacterium]MDZ4148822.1 UDP-glucose 4-epimerase GalE [Flavobacteriaceae bacterium]
MSHRILITGGLGYIGSHTAVELINEGYQVVIIDDLSNSSLDVLDGIEQITSVRPEFVKADMRDKQALNQFFDNHQVDGVIHFSAFKAVGESVEKPLAYYENNLNALVYLLQELTVRNIHSFIFSSSCTVYGQADQLPVTEKAPVKPAESPYGYTKQVGEIIIRDTVRSTNLKAVALRYFNPIGAHPTAIIGELPLGIPQNLVPFITQTAIGLRSELSVFGNDYPTPDGTAIRDYIHVVDLAKAHIAALERLLNQSNKENFEVFNIGTGKGSSVLEVIQTFEKATSQKLNYKITSRRSGDIVAAYADTALANKELGWKAKSSLEEALASAWAWEKKIRS